MKLNPLKCVFGVESSKFLGFKMNYRGIEAYPNKIKTLDKHEVSYHYQPGAKSYKKP